MTSAVLLVGALCHLPSGLRSLRESGILLAVIVVAAYVADVAFLPRLIVRYLSSVSWGTAGPGVRESGGDVCDGGPEGGLKETGSAAMFHSQGTRQRQGDVHAER